MGTLRTVLPLLATSRCPGVHVIIRGPSTGSATAFSPSGACARGQHPCLKNRRRCLRHQQSFYCCSRKGGRGSARSRALQDGGSPIRCPDSANWGWEGVATLRPAARARRSAHAPRSLSAGPLKTPRLWAWVQGPCTRCQMSMNPVTYARLMPVVASLMMGIRCAAQARAVGPLLQGM